jgi:hypothetical protein
MQAKLRTKIGCPYGNIFELNLPEKGMKGRGTSFEQLIGNIKEWRRANAFPIGLGFESEVEREICERYPAECHSPNPLLPDPQRRLGYDAILHGTSSLLRVKKDPNPYVDQTEANRRAAICSACPQNQDFVRPCGFLCGALKDAVMALIGNRSTPHDNRLKSCQICQCFAAGAVHIRTDLQLLDLSQKQLDQFKEAHALYGCWKVLPG